MFFPQIGVSRTPQGGGGGESVGGGGEIFLDNCLSFPTFDPSRQVGVGNPNFVDPNVGGHLVSGPVRRFPPTKIPF